MVFTISDDSITPILQANTVLTKDDFLAWMDALQVCFSENKAYLTELDSAIGDADHGINMDRGFSAVKTELKTHTPQDITGLLKAVAMTLIKTVGGASGPLYGSFFLRASTSCAGKAELEPADIVALFAQGLQGVVHRGKAQLQDKTMLDSLSPALEAMKRAMQQEKNLNAMMQQATRAAEEGMKATIPLQARKGRASYLGERSIGHQDPGATSAYLLLKTASDVWSA